MEITAAVLQWVHAREPGTRSACMPLTAATAAENRTGMLHAIVITLSR
jgi:hypothetical protein